MVTISLLLCATFALSCALPLEEVIAIPLADQLPEMKAVKQNTLLEESPEELLAGEMAAEEREVQTEEVAEDEGEVQTEEVAEDEGEVQTEEVAEDEGEVQTEEVAEDEGEVQAEKVAEEEGELLAGEMAGAEVMENGLESRLVCPSGWSIYESRCFIFINSPTSWPSAERHCVHFGANLASVHSSGEYLFLQEVVRRGTGGFPRTWIGGTDAVQNRLWFWSDGSRFDYQNWVRGEPNNSNGREPCIEMNFGVDIRWNDQPCGQRFPFICAKRLTC